MGEEIIVRLSCQQARAIVNVGGLMGGFLREAAPEAVRESEFELALQKLTSALERGELEAV